LIPASLLPPEEAVDVAVLATGKSATTIMVQIAQAVGAIDATDSQRSLESARSKWHAWLGQSSRQITIVVDALDEAANADEVLTKILRELEEPGSGERRV